MSAHTPGPWHYVASSWSNASVITKNECICGLDISYADEKNQLSLESVMAANARLIAAAPNLLEALQYAVKQVPELATIPGISAAIAEATGNAA